MAIVFIPEIAMRCTKCGQRFVEAGYLEEETGRLLPNDGYCPDLSCGAPAVVCGQDVPPSLEALS